MEEVCNRFPHLVEETLEHLDSKSLTNAREAGREIFEFLAIGKVWWKQIIIKKFAGNNFSLQR